jgi:hypothetical protein
MRDAGRVRVEVGTVGLVEDRFRQLPFRFRTTERHWLQSLVRL